MNSKSTFGKEIGLIHQVIMLGRKYSGNIEGLWKALTNKEFLAFVIDFASFHYGTTISCADDHQLKRITLVCFSENDIIFHDEVTARVKRFGRFATDDELKILCKKLWELWNVADRLTSIKFPVLACGPSDIKKHPEFALAIQLGEKGPVLVKINLRNTSDEERKFYWMDDEIVTFATVVEKSPLKDVIKSRHDGKPC